MKIDTATQVFNDYRSRHAELVSVAESIESPNAKDTVVIKCAMAGFAQRSSLDNWGRDHFEFVSNRLAECSGTYPEDVERHYAICLGSICALAFERSLSEAEFQLADTQLVGLLFSLGGKL
jgi:hypothetical protein